MNDKEDMDCVICGDEKSCYTFFKCNHKCCFDCFIQMNKYQCYYNCDQDENESLYESDFETASEQDDNDVEPEEHEPEETGLTVLDDDTKLDKTEMFDQMGLGEVIKQYFIDHPGEKLFNDESD